MPCSLHSHSGQFCLHASDDLESMVLKAIEKGYLVFGLSEHVPRFEIEHLYPEETHLKPDDLANTFDKYVIEANRLKIKYKEQIEILIGAETEYLGLESIHQLNSLLTKYNIDYLVGSIHHVSTIPIDFSKEIFLKALEFNNNDYEQLFLNYFEQQYEMIKYFKPKVIGHFDVIRLFSSTGYHLSLSNSVYKLIDRNIKYIVEYNGLFEINTAAYKKGLSYAYPMKDIALRIKKLNGKFTISDDAHRPNEVAQYYDKLYQYLHELEIDELYCLSKKTKLNVNHIGTNESEGELKVVKIENWKNHIVWN